MKEYWKKIPEFQRYSVSSIGRVRIDIETPKARKHPGQCITHYTRKNGYQHIVLINGVKLKCVYIHRIVAHTFLGPCPNKHEVNHIDFNPSNNSVENLEYVTRFQNKAHSVLAKRHLFGERHGNAKLTESKVLEMRKIYAKILGIRKRLPFYELGKIAKQFGVHQNHVYATCKGRFWKHLPLISS